MINRWLADLDGSKVRMSSLGLSTSRFWCAKVWDDRWKLLCNSLKLGLSPLKLGLSPVSQRVIEGGGGRGKRSICFILDLLHACRISGKLRNDNRVSGDKI